MSNGRSRIYLDFNAGMPALGEAVAATVHALEELAGNPSSAHLEGRTARRMLTDARREVAALVDADPAEIVFVSGGTEANVGGLWGLLAGEGKLGERRLLVSATEHPAVAEAAEQFGRLGVRVTSIPVDGDGRIRCDALTAALEKGAGAVVAVQLANQETGVLQPIDEVVRLAHGHGARVHCDAVQAAGRVPLSFPQLGVDTLAIAGHKFGAPPGAGALVVRDAPGFAALIPGSQEAHRRGGTENVPGIVGFGVAARIARERLSRWADVRLLRDRLEADLTATLDGVTVLGARAPRLPNTSCLCLPPSIRGGTAVAALDLDGIAVSSGPACSSGVERSSAVAEAMGFMGEVAERTVRISLGLTTSVAELEAVVEAIGRAVQRGSEGAT